MGVQLDHKIDLIGIPIGLGGRDSHSQLGPAAFMSEGLDVALSEFGEKPTYKNIAEKRKNGVFESSAKPIGRIHYKNQIVQAGHLAAEAIELSLGEKHLPIILGGDHSPSAFTIPAVISYFAKKEQRVGVIWIDGHLDAHTEKTSPTHHAHGMPLSAALGFGALAKEARRICRASQPFVTPGHLIHIGAGEDDVEEPERKLFAKLNITTFSAQHLRSPRTWPLLQREIQKLMSEVHTLVVSFDLDAVHHLFAPGVCLPSRSGLSNREVVEIGKYILPYKDRLSLIEITEYDPTKERRDEYGAKTIRVVKNFLQSIFRVK